MSGNEIKDYSSEVDRYYERLIREASASGYHINPDVEFAKALIEGILGQHEPVRVRVMPLQTRHRRPQRGYGHHLPCDYRDADVEEHGACYCALYVSEAVSNGKRKASSIPEGRPPTEKRTAGKAKETAPIPGNLAYPVWRCKVCGYLCAREEPPGACPICKAAKDRFERFL